jgi:hypothetical protein
MTAVITPFPIARRRAFAQAVVMAGTAVVSP